MDYVVLNIVNNLYIYLLYKILKDIKNVNIHINTFYNWIKKYKNNNFSSYNIKKISFNDSD